MNRELPGPVFKTYSRKNLKLLSLTGSQFVVPKRAASQTVCLVQDAHENRSRTKYSPEYQKGLTRQRATSPSSSSSSSESLDASSLKVTLSRKTQELISRISTSSRSLSSKEPPRKRRLPINELTLVPAAEFVHFDSHQPTRGDDESDDSIADDLSNPRKTLCRSLPIYCRSTNPRPRNKARIVSINTIRNSFKRTPWKQKRTVQGTVRSLRKNLKRPANDTGSDGFVGTELIVPPRLKVRSKRQPKTPPSVPGLELRRGLLPEVVFLKDQEWTCLDTHRKISAPDGKDSVSQHKVETRQPGRDNSFMLPLSHHLTQSLPSDDDEASYVQGHNQHARRSTHEILASVMTPTPDSEAEAQGNMSDDEGLDDEDDDGDRDEDSETADMIDNEEGEPSLCSEEEEEDEEEEEEEERVLYGVP